MIKKNTHDEIAQYPGLISGAYLIGLVESFDNTKIIDPHRLPFDFDSVQPTGWYPYDYLMGTIRLTEKLLPDSSSILFWAGVRFMELWYWHGPGKEMIYSGMDWVYANQTGEGYNSVAKGGSPAEIGWTRNLVTNDEEGFALVENVMPLRAEYLRGIYYGGFLLFDDMAYFNTEIYCESIDPKLPHHRTVIKLIFRPKNKEISDERFSESALKNSGPLSAMEAEELLWRFKHLTTISMYREKYNRDITKILRQANQELLAAEREQARQMERQRLLKEMHDGLGSQLATARIRVSQDQLSPAEGAALLGECLDDLHLLVDTLGNTERSLARALADFRYRCERRLAQERAQVRWRLSLADCPLLPERTLLQLLRILQEGLTNALKHAQASQILIEAGYAPEGSIELSVTDDGVGLPTDIPYGRGLGHLESRARDIGAHLVFERLDPGTRLRLTLPFSPP